MNGMGRHNHPNGHHGEDGAVATFEPLAIATALTPQRLVPFQLPWTGPGQEEPVVMDKKRIDGDTARRASMWVLASGVAAIAAIVSYSHIYDLGRAHGGSGVAARLLQLSADMLIVVGELMLLHEADAKGRRFMLGWVLVWSGILATLAANVTYGAQFGYVGALIWGWPAYSFILAAGGMVAVVKRTAGRDAETPAGAVLAPPAGMDKPADKRVDKPAPRRVDKPQARTVKKAVTALDKARDIINREPGLSNEEAARRAGVSAKTIQRARVVPIGERKRA